MYSEMVQWTDYKHLNKKNIANGLMLNTQKVVSENMYSM